MKLLIDFRGRIIRLTEERENHIEVDHPEMVGQIERINETLKNPNIVVRSNVDLEVELFYRHYNNTPVTEKYLCVVVKVSSQDLFIITAYFTDRVKRGEILWERE